jgi:hypothetical protein
MYLQHIAGFEPTENLRYSIYITTQKGESEPIDLPFLLPQSRIFRAFDLTPDLNMRYGSDIHIVSEKLRYLCFSQYTCTLGHLIFSHIICNFQLQAATTTFGKFQLKKV